MNIKDIAKVILSYVSNPFSLIRIGKVGKWVDIRRGLKVNSPKNIILGNNVRIDRMSRLSSYEGGIITIEDGCYIGQFFSVMAGGDIVIRKNTLIASYVAVISENHSMNPEAVKYGNQPLIKANTKSFMKFSSTMFKSSWKHSKLNLRK